MITLFPDDVAPADVKAGDYLGLKVIAAIGWTHDWAAYQGPIDWPDEQVARQGDKLLREAAEALFPDLVRLNWNYRD